MGPKLNLRAGLRARTGFNDTCERIRDVPEEIFTGKALGEGLCRGGSAIQLSIGPPRGAAPDPVHQYPC
jgi:hypothetical protein